MKKLTKTDLITLALTALVPAGAYLGYFKGRIAELKTLSEKNENLSRQAADGRRASTDVTLAREKLRRFTEHIDKFMGSMTTQDEANKAVGAIVKNAKDAGIKVEMLKPGEPVEGKILNYLPVNLSASGEFTKLFDFLQRVECDPTVMTVNSMHIESDPLSTSCSVKVELRVYFVKSTAEARKEAQT